MLESMLNIKIKGLTFMKMYEILESDHVSRSIFRISWRIMYEAKTLYKTIPKGHVQYY